MEGRLVTSTQAKLKSWTQDRHYLGSMLWSSQFSAIFANFSAKKMAFFLKTNAMIKIW
jgi:hypothetical protein